MSLSFGDVFAEYAVQSLNDDGHNGTPQFRKVLDLTEDNDPSLNYRPSYKLNDTEFANVTATSQKRTNPATSSDRVETASKRQQIFGNNTLVKYCHTKERLISKIPAENQTKETPALRWPGVDDVFVWRRSEIPTDCGSEDTVYRTVDCENMLPVEDCDARESVNGNIYPINAIDYMKKKFLLENQHNMNQILRPNQTYLDCEQSTNQTGRDNVSAAKNCVHMEGERRKEECSAENQTKVQRKSITTSTIDHLFSDDNSRRITLPQLAVLSMDSRRVIDFLRHCLVVPSEMMCPKCEHPMNFSYNEESFRCYKTKNTKNGRKQCGGCCSIRYNTWFSQCKLKLGECLQLLYMLVYNYTTKDIMHEIQPNINTLHKWFISMRKSMTHWAIRCSLPIGGRKRTVEIREMKSSFETKSEPNDEWICTGIDRDNGDIFMVVVPDKTSRTLADIIQQWILPETAVVTDSWNASVLLDDKDYASLMDDHKLTFPLPKSGEVNADDTLKGWHCIRRCLPHSNKKHLNKEGCLSHYMFFRYCQTNNLDPFKCFLREVKKVDYIG